MRILILVLTLALAVPALSCNRAAPGVGDTKTVALVLKTLNNPFFIDMRRGAQEDADANATQGAAGRRAD